MGHQRLDKALAAMPGVQAEKEWCAVGLRWSGRVERTHVAEVLMQPCWAAQSDMSCSPAWQPQPGGAAGRRHACSTVLAATTARHQPDLLAGAPPCRHAYLLDWDAPTNGEPWILESDSLLRSA